MGRRTVPQQGAAPVSPVLANLFLHYAFEARMAREFPGDQFERYVDDAAVHCVSERRARMLVEAIGNNRMEAVGLRLHPAKPRTVYCKDANRKRSYEHTSFTFLGFTFRGFRFRTRSARSKHGGTFPCFLPAVSRDALKKMGAAVRTQLAHAQRGGERWCACEPARSNVRSPAEARASPGPCRSGARGLLRGGCHMSA
nr:hypothetical protein StreXyl84_63130 [Streptomyces sp. Xyl84]